MRALIVGMGSIGTRHLRNLRRLRPVAEIGGVTSRKLAELDEKPDHVFASLEEGLSFRPEVAIVAGPAVDHLATALALAESGVHLLIEKPIAVELKGLAELLDACALGGLTLMVGYNLRFHPAVIAMHEAVHAGRIGDPLSIRAIAAQNLRDWRPGRDYRRTVSARSELGGGVLFELSHELDLARWMLGEVGAVSALTARLSGLAIDVEDSAEILLEFAGGALGSVHLDMARAVPVRRCEIAGTEGTLRLDLLASSLSLTAGAEARELELIAEPDTERNRMYLSELAHFLDCAQNGAPPAVTGEDGLAALQMVLAARRSAAEGRTIRL